MPVTVTYIGPDPGGVDVPAARAIAVKPGDSIEVPDELAPGMLCQEDNWVLAGADKAPAAKTKAPKAPKATAEATS